MQKLKLYNLFAELFECADSDFVFVEHPHNAVDSDGISEDVESRCAIS